MSLNNLSFFVQLSEGFSPAMLLSLWLIYATSALALGIYIVLIFKKYWVLNKIQKDSKIEAAMKLEDLFLEEQDAIATKRRLLKEMAAKLEETETQRQEEALGRKEAEAEIERLKKLLDESD